MADELEGARLDVALEPSGVDPRGKVRVVQGENPEWYQRLCRRYASLRTDMYRWKKHKTAIKRHTTLRALRNIVSGHVERQSNGRTAYIPLLLPFIEEELEKRRELERQIARDQQAEVPF